MEILVLLIPLSIVLIAAAAWAFLWAVRHRQFDHLDSHGFDVLDEEKDT